MGMVLERSRNIPLVFGIYSGIISNIVTLKRIVESIKKLIPKIEIIMEGLSGTIQISELCRKYIIKPARFYSWKEKLIKNSTGIFDDRGRKGIPANKRIGDMQAEITRLKDTIAEIASRILN